MIPFDDYGEAILRASEVGTVACCVTMPDAAGDESAVLMVRETDARVARMARQPARVSMRGGVLAIAGIPLVAVLMRVDAAVYKVWLNFHSPGGRRAFALLAEQAQVPVQFYPAEGEPHGFDVPNWLGSFFSETSRLLADSLAWTEAAFEQARVICEQTYLTPGELWAALDQTRAETARADV